MKKYYKNIVFYLYAIAALIIIIPIFIVLTSDKVFSSLFSTIIRTVSLLCIEIGLLIETFMMKKEGKPISKNVGTIIGVLLVMILMILK